MSQPIVKDSIPVRAGEELDSHKLVEFLQTQLGLSFNSIDIQQFPSGHSNLTYVLKSGEWEAVLRRPPLGPVAPKAHNMEREFNLLKEVQPLYPLAPKPLTFSNDSSIVGSPFFLMERKHGLVLDSFFPPHITETEELGRIISEQMVNQLVTLHSIDYLKTKLPEMSRADGFMERQVHGWITRYQRSKTEEIPQADQVMSWLVKNLPPSNEATIIHYDYKLNNAMFSEKVTEMIGLFDWEMATVGDPLVDLGVAMSYWIQGDDPPLLKNGLGKPPVTVMEGFLTRKEFIELYAKKSGRDVSRMNFYLTFAYFKLAVICQQIYYRYLKGQTKDQRFARFNEFVKSLLIHSRNIIVE
ncbi:phosphotransferase family protein [Bacillus sp. 2205SS5-2]|uniref:phosphotransferase family protein n=1 Tax=Bacillus sp. 2205SS5-2 TaxID=3109031 RepID=UPI003004AEC9